MKLRLAFVLLCGIAIGALTTLIVLECKIEAPTFVGMLHEDETETDAADRGVLIPEEIISGKLAATATLPFFAAPHTPPSATSSPLSIKVPVIVYHSVRPHVVGESQYQDLYDVTPELLEEQLTYLESHGYHTILMRDVDAYWRGATSSLPAKSVILSFDDGWKNQFTYAFPLLKKHHMLGVFYIFTNPIDHKKSHWMSWDDILALDSAGMEIGGHSRTHPILTKISYDNKKLDAEVVQPKQIIEKHLGHEITSFAYPFGVKDIATEIAVARAGYQIARTLNSGVWGDPQHRLEFHGTLSSDKMKAFELLLLRP